MPLYDKDIYRELAANKNFGAAVKSIRKNRGYTIDGLADKLGLSRQTIINAESSSTKAPTTYLDALMTNLNITLDLIQESVSTGYEIYEQGAYDEHYEPLSNAISNILAVCKKRNAKNIKLIYGINQYLISQKSGEAIY